MQKIIPHLWFAEEAKEASEFYTSVFGENSKVTSVSVLKDTPGGDSEVVTFTLRGQDFMAISAGPLFRFNPSISFILNFDPSKNTNAETELNTFWEKLSEGGTSLMPLDEYPFSKRYGWIQDKYGLSWQLILTNPEGDPRPFITPALLFVGDMAGRAEEAMKFYLSVFKNSKEGMVARYGEGREPDKEGTIMYEDFMLEGVWFAAMDSAQKHDFAFNEAISFMVSCDSQKEIDYYWEKLSADQEAEQCGWLKDQFGVSWQIVPSRMGEFMSGSEEQRTRVTQTFLKMKKFDIAGLEKAYRGE